MTVKMVAFKNHYFCCEQVILFFFICDTWMMSSWHPNLIGKVCPPSWTSYFLKKNNNFIHCHFTGEDNLILFDLYQPIIVKNSDPVSQCESFKNKSGAFFMLLRWHIKPYAANYSNKKLNEWKSVPFFSCNLLIFACDAIWLIWQSRSLTYILCIHSCLAAWS